MTLADRILTFARADDPRCADLLARADDPETVGELIVAVHATGTAAAARAVALATARPFRRGAWQGAKRVFKVVERRLLDEEAEPAPHDVDLFAHLIKALEVVPAWSSPVRPRTIEYMQRRAYRALKALGHRRPARFRALLGRLLPRYGSASAERWLILHRVLRTAGAPPPSIPARFVPVVDNPYATLPPAPDPAALLALSAEDLVRPVPPPAAPPVPPLAAPPPAWKGPIFVERWAEDPAWLVETLERTRHETAATVLVRVAEERVGDGLLHVPLDRFYGLLHHPVAAVWRLGLSQLAARAHKERLRWGELVLLVERAAHEERADWAVLADLLAVLDVDAAEAEHPALLAPLRDLLLRRGVPASFAAAVVDLLRRRLGARLVPPAFGWSVVLGLVEGDHAEVRALGRELASGAADLEVLAPPLLERLLRGPLPQDDPELVQRVLVRPRAQPGGYRPGPDAASFRRWAELLDRVPEPAFLAVRRALLTFEEEGGLPPAFALGLLGGERRARALGLELLGGALRRGAHPIVELPRLLSAPFEDVVVWVRERLEAEAAAGRLPNEALYRVLDAAGADVQAFGRDLVRAHLERFAGLAEVIVFCAESPDAATSDLGIGLYEERLKGGEAAFDLRRLVPMFRILLYRPATARAEKERVHGTLRRWALEAPEHARLVVDVVAELRRTASQVDRTRVVQLLAVVHERFPDVAVPFATARVFTGHKRRRATAWTSR